MDSTYRELSETDKTPYCDAGKELMRTLSNKIRYNTNDGLVKKYRPNYSYSFYIPDENPIVYATGLQIFTNYTDDRCNRIFESPNSPMYFYQTESKKNICTAFYQTLIGKRLTQIKETAFQKMRDYNMKSFSTLTEQKFVPPNGSLLTELGSNIQFNDNTVCIVNSNNQQEPGSLNIEFNDNPAASPCRCDKLLTSQRNDQTGDA